MTYPMPRDNVFLDPSGAVTTAPSESYRDQHEESEELEHVVAHADAAAEDDEGEAEARSEEARSAEGDEDDDAEIHDAEIRDADIEDAHAGDDEEEDGDEDDMIVDGDEDIEAEDDDEDESEYETDDSADADAALGLVGESDKSDEYDNFGVSPVGIPQQAAVADVTATATAPDSDDFRDRWQLAQLSFIDDPRGAAEAARALAAEVLESHVSALRDRQERLDAWQSEAAPDTEVLRAAMRGYRDMFESLTRD